MRKIISPAIAALALGAAAPAMAASSGGYMSMQRASMSPATWGSQQYRIRNSPAMNGRFRATTSPAGTWKSMSM